MSTVALDVDAVRARFSALRGTVALLEPADQALIAGFLINKFRGDPAILAPGLEQLRALTGRPTLGVLPWLDGRLIDAGVNYIIVSDVPGLARLAVLEALASDVLPAFRHPVEAG